MEQGFGDIEERHFLAGVDYNIDSISEDMSDFQVSVPCTGCSTGVFRFKTRRDDPFEVVVRQIDVHQTEIHPNQAFLLGQQVLNNSGIFIQTN